MRRDPGRILEVVIELIGDSQWFLDHDDRIWTRGGTAELAAVPEILSDPNRYIEFDTEYSRGSVPEEGEEWRGCEEQGCRSGRVRIFGRAVASIGTIFEDGLQEA